MKKLSILCSSLLISLCIAAQKTSVKTNPADNFCNTLLKVIAQAPGQFEKLKTGGYLAFLDPVTGIWVGQGWVASINFPGAFLSNIKQGENYPSIYNAWFGTYQSKADAKKEANIIKKQLMTCLPDYAVEDRSSMGNNLQGFPLHFLFIGKKRGNNPQQIINFFLVKDSSIHSIYLEILGADVNGNVLKEIMKKPVTEKKELVNKSDQVLKDLFDDIDKWKALQPDTTSVSPAQPKLAKQLNQLLDNAKDGFKSIKGEEIKTYNADLVNSNFDQKIYSRFKTGFLPEGAEKSEVRYYPADKSTKFIASYRYYFYPESSFRVLFDKMKKELGNDFIAEVDVQSINKKVYDKSQKVVFYSKSSKQPQIELIFNNDDTIINGMPPGILIVVEAPNRQSNISYAQVNKFNEQLSSIVAGYASNFATIKGEMKTTGSKGYFYSKVQLQGADSVYLAQSWINNRLSFIAVYPNYSSKEEARKKFDELVAQIDKCNFSCCTFAKTDVSDLSSMVVQAWMPFDLYRKMDAAYENILLEVEIHKGFEIDEKFALKHVWQLVLRVKKL